jgi:glycosyltransferase involved in cell wall biosynthesis
LRIAIIGTRGIPNNYGGFEQFAQYLSLYLVEQGIDITVYNSSSNPFQGNKWNGINIIHKNDPENKLGTFGQFIYDLNCILDTRKQKFDIILQLGYTSSSIWGFLLPGRSLTITNMDGLEWKRSKYNWAVRKFLRLAEYLAIVFSDLVVSDSIGIQNYIKTKYKKNSSYIPYGANVFNNPDIQITEKYELKPYEYSLLIARMEPENNIDTIIEGVQGSDLPLVIIGNHENSYGEYLKKKWSGCKNCRFLGPIYDLNVLDNLRYHSKFYFHGHSVGGTNPSLLEAMASHAYIIAHNNIFNQSILGEDAQFFNHADDIERIISGDHQESRNKTIHNNLEKIDKFYSWPKVNEQYYTLFKSSLIS